MTLFQRDDLISRINFAISQGVKITLIVGSPISFDYQNRKGVPDVAGVIEHIKQGFIGDADALDALRRKLETPDSNAYQVAFEYVLGVRGARYVNNLIRQAVLAAYCGSDPEQANANPNEWYLPPAVESIGKIFASRAESFGCRIITTNFDPLLEAAIQRAGGKAYSTFLHRDGNPAATRADGVNIIHLHGFWQGSDTLHTPTQLRQNRPQLRSYLAELFRKTLVLVIGYGGWDDVVGNAIEDVVLDDGSEHEFLWAFKNNDLSHLEISESKLLNRLRPGSERGRVQLYGGVDCHDIFPMLADSLVPSTGFAAASADNSSPANIRRPMSPQEKELATYVGFSRERRIDATPRIDDFIGRENELAALAAADATVVCLTGLGGLGKSALAAKMLAELDEEYLIDWRDCREQSNTAQTALSLFLERISAGQISAESMLQASQSELVDLIIDRCTNKKVALVLDNVDTYIDVDNQRPLGVIGHLCDRLLDTQSELRVILTCRPHVQMAHSRFFGLSVPGLEECAVRQLFQNKSGGYSLSADECAQLMLHSGAHPLYVSMLAAQRLSSNRQLSSILQEVAAFESDVPAMIFRSTYKLLNEEQKKLLRLIAELERPELESALEEIAGLRYNKLSKILRKLKDLNLIQERRDLNDKTLIDLHPLVRQFLRWEYPKKDRESFIGQIIVYFDKKLAVVAKLLGKQAIPTSVLELWIHKLEVLCNQADWEVAVSELLRINDELDRAGLVEDLIRLGVKIFNGINWLVAIEEIKDFRKLINNVCHELSHRGEHAQVRRWADHYMETVGARSADKVNVKELLAYDAWLRKSYAEAIELASEAVELAKRVDFTPPTAPSHTLALAHRESGNVEAALPILLEGLSLDEALNESNGKSPEFYGNLGRCFFISGNFELALKFYRYCGRGMRQKQRSFHNTGWIRLWAAEVMQKAERLHDAYSFAWAAKHIWARGSKLLEGRADNLIAELRRSGTFSDDEVVPEWLAEKMFNAWLVSDEN